MSYRRIQEVASDLRVSISDDDEHDENPINTKEIPNVPSKTKFNRKNKPSRMDQSSMEDLLKRIEILESEVHRLKDEQNKSNNRINYLEETLANIEDESRKGSNEKKRSGLDSMFNFKQEQHWSIKTPQTKDIISFDDIIQTDEKFTPKRSISQERLVSFSGKSFTTK